MMQGEHSNKIAGRAYFYRRDGRWCLLVEGPDWVVSEIARDAHDHPSIRLLNSGGPIDSGTHTFLLSIGADPAPPADPPDALTGILAHAVEAQGGRCLTCGEHPALYCGLDCARRGR